MKDQLDRPIFIVGAGRSGTTLLRSLLSAHSRIAVPPETHFLKRAERDGGLRKQEIADFPSFWNEFTGWVRFRDLDVSPERCLELIGPPEEATYRRVFSALLHAYCEKVGKDRVGEKTPGHAYYLKEIFEWYPDARVIVVRRDPRAVIASHMKTPFAGHQRGKSLRNGLFRRRRLTRIAELASTWNHLYTAIVPRWEADARVRIVAYEDLVLHAENVVREICAFIEEPFESEMMSPEARASVPAGAGQMDGAEWDRWRKEHHRRSTAPISADSLEKWRQGLATTEASVIEGICADGMRRWHYDREYSRSSRMGGRTLGRFVIAASQFEENARRRIARIRRYHQPA